MKNLNFVNFEISLFMTPLLADELTIFFIESIKVQQYTVIKVCNLFPLYLISLWVLTISRFPTFSDVHVNKLLVSLERGSQ